MREIKNYVKSFGHRIRSQNRSHINVRLIIRFVIKTDVIQWGIIPVHVILKIITKLTNYKSMHSLTRITRCKNFRNRYKNNFFTKSN